MESTAVQLDDQQPEKAELLAEVLSGLSAEPKQLSPKFFYDKHGSELFERITRTPEYYPTRTEIDIMKRNAADIARRVGPQASLIEFGSGSSVKTRILLDHLDELAAYVPVDISGEHLMETAKTLAKDYPDLEILPVCADFTQPFDLPSPRVYPRRNVVYFPGSTIGNFTPEGARQLLRVMAAEARAGGAAIIGVDLQKDRAVLERAYNDAQGVTAAFNLNVLRRINRELGSDFDLDGFHHRAVYNENQSRIEMHLISRSPQTVQVAGEQFAFEAGEYILTELSHKYLQESFAAMAEEAGFKVEAVWTDEAGLFSVQFLCCYGPHR